jgi:thiol:disulfide interchange protein DsbC
MKKVLEQREDIAFYIMMYPLPMHKDAYKKSKSIVCENSLALLEDAYDKKRLPEPTCETSIVDDTIKLARSLDISGTPALILPNGSIVSGFKKADAIIGLIDKK